MNRIDIINRIAAKFNYTTYLEIGVFNGDCFKEIKIDEKWGVDPSPSWADERIALMTSDAFFTAVNPNKRYDLIFIDGLHTEEQAGRDILNALKHLTPNGTIVVHDCNPPTEWHQRDKGQYTDGSPWNGTTWKAFVNVRQVCASFVVDCDWGIGVIRTGWDTAHPSLMLNKDDEPTQYKWLEGNRVRALNLIKPREFIMWLEAQGTEFIDKA